MYAMVKMIRFTLLSDEESGGGGDSAMSALYRGGRGDNIHSDREGKARVNVPQTMAGQCTLYTPLVSEV